MGCKKIGSKKSFYWTILGRLNQDTILKNIQNEFNISKQKLNYYIRQLRKEGLIINKGRGWWEVVKGCKNMVEHTQKSSKNIRGHAFIWTIKIPDKYKLNFKERLNNLKIRYKLIRGCTPRIIINNRKVWIGKKTITIFEPHSFYGQDAIESRKYAVIRLLETVGLLELKLELSLRPYEFHPAREHYGLIKNDLAIQCNRKGEKIYIRDNKEGLWLWIDDSESLGELETGGKKALLRNIQVQRWWNDNKKYNFKVTPTFLMERMNQVTSNQIMFAQNIEKHMNILNEMGKALKKIQEKL